MSGSTMEQMQNSMRRAICGSIEFRELGIGKSLVHTGYTYPDGDEFRIVLEIRKNGEVILTDEGHTMMWLSYEDFNHTEVRTDLIRRSLSSVEFDDGEIFIHCDSSNIGAALQTLIQALQSVSDMIFLRKETVRSTFLEDVKTIFIRKFKGRCEIDKEIKIGNDLYNLDVYMNIGNRPLYVLIASNKDRCKEATITAMAVELANKTVIADVPVYPLVMSIIDENASDITKKDIFRLINKTDKTFSSPNEVENGIVPYLKTRGLSEA